MIPRHLIAVILITGIAVAPQLGRAHAEHDKARYVAADGVDTGRCDNVLRPCGSISYAASQAGKGDRILVARGQYAISSAEDLFYLTSGIIQVYGGFNRFDHYQKQAPDDNPTILIGVSPQFRQDLANRGFGVIADGKGISRERQAEVEQLNYSYELLTQNASATDCVGGSAGGFACNSINLQAHVALNTFDSNPGSANDIWGFVDLNTEREYAIIGLQNSTAVVDVTDPENPVEIGFVTGQNTIWRDIKVYQFFDAGADRWRAYAYVTADSANDRLTIIDLSDLPNSIRLVGRLTSETRAHNVYIGNVDYSSGITIDGHQPVLFTGGSNLSGGGFRAYSLANPENPALTSASPLSAYMHDASSLIVDDARVNSQCINAVQTCPVLLDFNESSIELWDYSSPNDPRRLNPASITYVGAAYIHSGWWSENKLFMFVHDELDEQSFGLNTTLRVFDLSNLTAPTLVETWSGSTGAIDHNGYVRGNRYYMSNYTRGLTVLDISDPSNIPMNPAGFFDTYTVTNTTSFNGAWGVYPFLPSGNILVSDINSGLYILEDDTLSVTQGQIAFADSVGGVLEGSAASIDVVRNGGTAGAVTVDYETLSATADLTDYQPASGTLTWVNGEAGAKQINLNAATADAIVEDGERFFVRLINPTGGATLASPSVTSMFISDVGAASEIEFASVQYTVAENAGRVVAVVNRRGSAAGDVMVGYQTVAGSASAGSDYTEVTNGQLNWTGPDATARTIEIPVLADALTEGTEDFQITLFNPNGATLGVQSQTTINIADVINSPPVANAGVDRSVDQGSVVNLSAFGSSDPDGDPLSYAWTQIVGQNVSLMNANQTVASFTAPLVQGNVVLIFQVEVTDTAANSSTDTISITVRAAPVGGGSGGGTAGWLVFVGLIALVRTGRRIRSVAKLL